MCQIHATVLWPQEPDSASAKLVTKLLGLVFDVMTKYDNTDSILLPVFPRLVSACLEATSSVPDPSGALVSSESSF